MHATVQERVNITRVGMAYRRKPIHPWLTCSQNRSILKSTARHFRELMNNIGTKRVNVCTFSRKFWTRAWKTYIKQIPVVIILVLLTTLALTIDDTNTDTETYEDLLALLLISW